MAVEIQLSNGSVAIVDEADVALVSAYRWHHGTGGYAVLHRGGKAMLMHRLILAAPAGVEVDHADGNTLNNTRANLRIATHSQNMANRKMHRNNTSGFRGVIWEHSTQSWRARISVNRKSISLGYFQDPKNAARAYNEAAKRHFGEFARLNVIPN